MKILQTSHFSGTTPFTQKVHVTSHTEIERFFCDMNELEYPLTRDRYTVVNEFGVFINDQGECCESWIRIADDTPTASYSPHAAVHLTGEQILLARRKLGWSQEELSRRAGIAQLTVGRIETKPEHATRQSILKKIDVAFRNAGHVIS